MALVPTIMPGLLDDVEHLRNAVVNFADEPALAGTPYAEGTTRRVADTFSPILCSTLVTKTPLRSPSSPCLEVEEELRDEE